ncbi:MAG TPA: RNA-guided endonuclease TnpB family protein [Planosporangium sp.]|jgi:transposase|nr:RNA-guided endonuclease TnpB family protein [Planosporangium sp.]
MSQVAKRAFKYRFYPTAAQAEQLTRTFGCVRPLYNKALDARTSAWATERRTITYGQTSALLTEWKRDPELAFHARVTDRRRNLLGNHCSARAISDAAWSQLRTTLAYKAAWYGRRLIVVDRWLPSSKTCSTCGRLAKAMPLNLREWTCPCGASHDRDVNAARNILAAGLVER